MPGARLRRQRRPRRAGAHRRPAPLLTPAGPAAGVDLGGTKCLGVRVSAAGQIEAEHRVPTPAGPDAIVDAIVDVVTALGPVQRFGVGAPGLVDRDGVLRMAPNLPGVVELGLRRQLAERFPDTLVVVDNDATCAAWAERQAGAAQGFDEAILVTLGTGIGGGLISGGQLARGANGFAGEIGHMVVDPNGPQCVCGKRGCWERFASGSGLRRLALEAAHAGRAPRLVDLAGGDPDSVRGEHVTAACLEGDGGALAVMERFGWWVALGLANLAYLFDPQVFVIGGGLVEAGDLLIEPTRASFAELLAGAAQGYRPLVPIVPAALGERAGAIGAAHLARDAPAVDEP